MPGDQPPGAVTEPVTPSGVLDQHRKDRPEHVGAFGGVDWSWVSVGNSPVATLLLPPDPGNSVILSGLIDRMSSRNRIIAPNIPPIPDSRKIVDGLASICRTEGISRVNLVGIGFGGVLAQLFAQRGPDVVNKVVLINTTTPEAWNVAADRTVYNLSRLAPAWVLRLTARSRMLGYAAPPKAERAHWRRLIRECLAQRRDRWEILSMRAAGFDAQRRAIEAGGWSLPGYEGRIQIVEATKDRHITPAQRAALKASCPSAHVRKIPEPVHWLGCVDPEPLLKIVDTFLNDINILDRTPGREH